MKVIQLNDRDANGNVIPLAEIDSLTFFASFNRTSSVARRQAILQSNQKGMESIRSRAADDFERHPVGQCPKQLGLSLMPRTASPLMFRFSGGSLREAVGKQWHTFDQNLFNEALGISQMGLARMSMSLFWMKPRGYLSLDKNSAPILNATA